MITLCRRARPGGRRRDRLRHQLRTPITGIRLVLEAALDDPATDPRTTIRETLAGADRLETTVTDLLALARGVPHLRIPLEVDTTLRELGERWNGPLAESEGARLTVTSTDPPTFTLLLPSAAAPPDSAEQS